MDGSASHGPVWKSFSDFIAVEGCESIHLAIMSLPIGPMRSEHVGYAMIRPMHMVPGNEREAIYT